MNTNRLIFPGFWFDKTPQEEALALARAGVGGFCFYGGNKQRVCELAKKLRAASPLQRILIAADYEDGLGRWLDDSELLPSNLAIGAANNVKLAMEKGFITACQARELGVDWVFAPVLDLADNSKNPIINTRAFGEDPKRVIPLAQAFMKGLAQGGVLNCLKHFPGHGNTTIDSHVALPMVLSGKKELVKALQPFQALLKQADSVMMGHLLIPFLDEKHPASLSSTIIHSLLQEKLGFHKCICTDALLMKALGNEKEAALAALKAGAHILLVPEKPFELMDYLQKASISEPVLKHAEQIINALCAQADELTATSRKYQGNVSQYISQVARKAIVATGDIPLLEAGETLHYLSVGNDENISDTPFLETLKAYGINIAPYQGEAVDNLAIVFWRRYQSFKGKISLSAQELAAVNHAAEKAKNTVLICFSNPWTSQSIPAKSSILTFSPAPAFQQTAAECLLGRIRPTGTLPITL